MDERKSGLGQILRIPSCSRTLTVGFSNSSKNAESMEAGASNNNKPANLVKVSALGYRRHAAIKPTAVNTAITTANTAEDSTIVLTRVNFDGRIIFSTPQAITKMAIALST